MAEITSEAQATATSLPRTKEKLNELTTAASLQYSLKNFTGAADHYADAVEIQAELNGEMAPENAELLFYYGRALYKVAIAKSDVLGTKVAQEEKAKPKTEKESEPASGEGSNAAANGDASEKKEETVDSKPYFQLTGDENWTDSEDEEEGAEGGEGGNQDEDDFQNAYETFEIARVLYQKQLDAIQGNEVTDKGKGKAELTPVARAIKEKLADCHGFLVEISLENERFHDAVSDARASLSLQQELHPLEHENVTEGHYSLSLALEFAAVRKAPEESTDPTDGSAGAAKDEEPEAQEINLELRKEAATHTELAIQSLEARLKKENEGLKSASLTEAGKKEKEAIIKDKSEILEDMKNRVSIVSSTLCT